MRETHRCEIAEASPADLDAILGVQVRAFSRVARDLAIDPAVLPPLGETREDLARLHAAGTRFFKATHAGHRVVAAVRATPDQDRGIVEVGRLVVEDGWENRGLGSALMHALETAHPDSTRFELFTGAEHDRAVRLYERLGYTVTRFETAPGGVRLVWMGKAPRR